MPCGKNNRLIVDVKDGRIIDCNGSIKPLVSV